MDTYIDTYTFTYINAYAHTYIHTYKHTYVQKHTRVHQIIHVPTPSGPKGGMDGDAEVGHRTSEGQDAFDHGLALYGS